MYSFIRTEPFHGFSSLYEVYNYNNHYMTTIVVGYCELNDIYYFTEYRGVTNKEVFIGSTDELCSILHAFAQFFEMLEYTDIISNPNKYSIDKMPPISLNKLYLYDSSGEVSIEGDDCLIIPEDCFLEDLVRCKAIEGTRFLLESPDDYFDEEELFIDLSENPFYCDGDELNGFYLSINDWIEIEKRAMAYNFNYRRNHPCSMVQNLE